MTSASLGDDRRIVQLIKTAIESFDIPIAMEPGCPAKVEQDYFLSPTRFVINENMSATIFIAVVGGCK